MRATSRWVVVVAELALAATVTIACTTRGVGQGPSVSPPPPETVTPTASVAPSPTASPGPASPLTAGGATLILSGDFTETVSLTALRTPAVWAPPPAPMDIVWEGTGAILRLSGGAFVSLAQTSQDRVLSFRVGGANDPLEFSSSAGECIVTITPALPDNVAGVFSCTQLTDADGTVTVDARGTFAATG